MDVVGAYEFYVIFARYAYQFRIYPLLYLEYGVIGSRHCGFVSLKFYIIVLSKHTFEPLCLTFGFLNFAGLYQSWQLAAKAGRAYDKSLVMFFEFMFVGARV